MCDKTVWQNLFVVATECMRCDQLKQSKFECQTVQIQDDYVCHRKNLTVNTFVSEL